MRPEASDTSARRGERDARVASARRRPVASCGSFGASSAPADADAEAAMEAKEARVLELTATVDRAMATIAERNAARDEARTALAARARSFAT